MWVSSKTRIARRRSWGVAAAAACLGWLLAVLLLVVGIRPLGWVLLGAADCTVALAALHARARRSMALEAVGFTCACILLQWPVLGFATLYVPSAAGVLKWE